MQKRKIIKQNLVVEVFNLRISCKRNVSFLALYTTRNKDYYNGKQSIVKECLDKQTNS